MEIVGNNFVPGDPRLVEQLVYELKSQGIFDQFRKECIADVDTKPAYQNLRQRVEGSVATFLKEQTWKSDLNKNQLRELLRKNIYECGYLETGVERIVDQVVNPKINTIFLPQVEDVVYRYLGIEKPNRSEDKKELKIDVTDLLPTDLEAISPESDHTKDDSLNFNDSLNSEFKMEEDESPPFEPINVQDTSIHNEENSVDSHLSGFSGLQSHESNPCMEPKECQMELSNQDSQVSQNSSESRLSIITSEDNTKMDIRDESDLKLLKSYDSNLQTETYSQKTDVASDTNSTIKDETMKSVDEMDSNCDNNTVDEKSLKKPAELEKDEHKINEVKKNKIEEKRSERKSDDRKSRYSDKYSSKDKREDKYRKSSSSGKDKSSSKRSSSSSSKDKTQTKDKKDSRSSSSSNRDNDKTDKDSYKNDKDKDKFKTDKDKDRNKHEKDKDRERKDKDKYDKDKNEKSKSSKEKEKSAKEKDKSKSSGSSSNNSSKYNSSKVKDKSSSSLKSDSSKKEKEKSSSSHSKDKSKSSYSESKSKSCSSDKHKRDDRNTHNSKHSSSSSSSSKKDKDKKKDSKKDAKDDHYSSKDKKTDRRSTDRDSNDGGSGKQGHMNVFSESMSSQSQKSSQESSTPVSGSGSGDSGTSDQNEHANSPHPTAEQKDNKEITATSLDTQKFKYIKPKFASNFEEARKLMKIRKQLAKLERQNQMSMAQIEVPTEVPLVNGISCVGKENVSEIIEEANIENAESLKKSVDESKVVIVNMCKTSRDENKAELSSVNENETSFKNNEILQSRDLSKESWEALEARLAQEMSTVNYNSYESPYDDYDYGRCNSHNSSTVSPIKTSSKTGKVFKQDDVEKNDTVTKEFVEKDIEEDLLNTIVFSTDERPKSEALSNVNEIGVQNVDKPIEMESDKSEEGTEKSEEDIEERNDDNVVKVINSKNSVTKNKQTIIIKLEDISKMKENIDINKYNETKMETDIGAHSLECKQTECNDIGGEHNLETTPSSDSECTHLEPLSPTLNANLEFLSKYIEKLEQDIKHSLKTSKNNFVPLKERRKKRKLADNVDLKNNNKAHYGQTLEIKKRRLSVQPHPNLGISKANKEKWCNISDITSNDNFSLPLSPAESDKSNEKKEEDSPKTKQKRESISKSITTRSQRYSSEDLYKPRPIFMGTRRSRGAKNMGK